MCAEALWWRCHRRIVADYAITRKLTVFHIFTPTKADRARERRLLGSIENTTRCATRLFRDNAPRCLASSTWYPSNDMLKPLVEDRLVALARRMIPCDALAVLRLEDDVLIPVVVDGLRGEATGRRFSPTEFPRLAEILKARGPVRFHDVTTPDPFDGLFADCGDELSRPHACMGCPVVVEDQTIGVITFDALDPTAFDRVADDTVAMLADLAGATIHTCELSTTHICAGALGVSKSGSGRAVTRTRYTRGGPGRVRTEAHRNR